MNNKRIIIWYHPTVQRSQVNRPSGYKRCSRAKKAHSKCLSLKVHYEGSLSGAFGAVCPRRGGAHRPARLHLAEEDQDL